MRHVVWRVLVLEAANLRREQRQQIEAALHGRATATAPPHEGARGVAATRRSPRNMVGRARRPRLGKRPPSRSTRVPLGRIGPAT